MKSEWTTYIIIDTRKNTASGSLDCTMIDKFATTNGIAQGSTVVVISQSPITDPCTGLINTCATQQIHQVPFNEDGENLGITVNPNLGLPPEMIHFNTSISSINSLTIQEIGVISVALNNYDSFVWIYKNQEELKNTLNVLRINYGYRED